MSKRKFRSGHGGFSLIELMLALALGLVVVTGIVQLFVGNSQTYAVLEGQSRLQENARFAFDFISRAAQTAGYWGCAPDRNNIVKGLRGNWNLIPEYDLTQAVQGYEGNAGPPWSPSLNTLPRTTGGASFNVHIDGNGVDTAVVAPGTDVVMFRSVRRPTQRLTQTLQPLGDPVITAPGGNPGFGVNDVVILSDCEQGAVFKVTAINVAGNVATLLHATATTGNFYENGTQVDSSTGLIPYTLSMLGRSYGPEASLGAFETTIFFIAPGAGVDNQGNTPLALWQKVGNTAPVELIEGVEDMEILYGVDTTLADGISNANRYTTFNNVPNVDQIVALRVTFTVNSVDAVSADDGRLQRTFTKTIAIRNSNPEV